MKNTYKILLVEDDINLGDVILDFLELQNYQVTRSFDGESAWNKFENDSFDLCIVDIMLPKMDGFSLIELMHKKNKDQAIIVLTAKSLQEDRIKGLKLGADDYITKPFNLEELNLRILSILKRVALAPKKEKSQGILKFGEHKIDLKNRILHIGGNAIELTRKELSLLQLLIEHKNTVVSREMAFKLIWNKDFDAESGSRSLDVYIVKLRKFLQDDNNISIQNVHGSGYKLMISKL